MDMQEKIQEAKARKKAFLKEMPESPRRLVKMRARANRFATVAIRAIPVWFAVLAALYLFLCLARPYAKCWMWNGIIMGVLFIVGAVLLLLLRSANRKRSDSYASTIPDFVKEYDRLDERIAALKKADAAQRKADRASSSAQKAQQAADDDANEVSPQA